MVAPSSRAARRRGGAGDGGGTIVAGRSDDRGGRRTPCARSRITARPALLQSGSAFGGTGDSSTEAPVEGARGAITVSDERYDVVVVGGGPGGSSAATFLCRGGLKVALFERDAFPRFHVGESLMPAAMLLLEQMGVRREIEARGFQIKYGAMFFDEEQGLERTFYFLPGQAWPNYSYEVPRAEFDTVLLEHARRSGAAVFQPASVESADFDHDGVTVRVSGAGMPPVVRARMLVDASGRSSFIATRLGDRFVAVGDAVTFVDPIFSGGVYIALRTGQLAAQAILRAFADGRFEARGFHAYQRQAERGVAPLFKFIHKYYEPVFFDLFMHPRRLFGMYEAVLNVLSGGSFIRFGVRTRLSLAVLFVIARISTWLSRRAGRPVESRLEW